MAQREVPSKEKSLRTARMSFKDSARFDSSDHARPKGQFRKTYQDRGSREGNRNHRVPKPFSNTLWKEALKYEDRVTIDGPSNIRLLELLFQQEQKEQLRRQQQEGSLLLLFPPLIITAWHSQTPIPALEQIWLIGVP